MLTKFPVLLFLLIAATTATSQRVVNKKTLRTVDCRAYKLMVDGSPNRKEDWGSGTPQELSIVIGDDVVAKIEFPKVGEVNNFSVDDIKKTKSGFLIKADWGASLSHYEIQFNFRCKRNNFYLYRVKKLSLLTVHPEGGFWDKQVTKVTKPHAPIEKFVMTRYL